jgi:hypothetical protein
MRTGRIAMVLEHPVESSSLFVHALNGIFCRRGRPRILLTNQKTPRENGIWILTKGGQLIRLRASAPESGWRMGEVG